MLQKSKILDRGRRALATTIDAGSRRSGRLAGLILMYHGVAQTSDDPSRTLAPALAVEELRAHLEHLRRRYDVVPARDLQERAAARAAGDRFPVALTFDDDLESHRTLVAPLLTELGLPATFFLTGAMLDGAEAFWWQDLNVLYARGGEDWRQVCRECDRIWGPTGGGIGLKTLGDTIEMLPPEERDALAKRLREMVGAPPEPGLSEDGVRDLAGAGFEIGWHTRAHYQLQSLDDSALRDAMTDGLERLSAVAGQRLEAIAYPYGHADLTVAAAAARAGFERGFVWSERAVDRTSHPMLLDRVDAWQPSAAAFAFRLARTVEAAG